MKKVKLATGDAYDVGNQSFNITVLDTRTTRRPPEQRPFQEYRFTDVDGIERTGDPANIVEYEFSD